jgi:autotransporter-associated beta strand protein
LDASGYRAGTLTLGALTGEGAVTLGDTETILRVGALGTDTQFAGIFSGSGELVKTGDGVFTFSGVSDLTGNTTIEGGTLHLTGSLAASAQTFVNDGATLSGTGTIGALTIEAGGTLSPGASPGTLFADNTILAGGGNLRWEINDADGVAGADPGWDLLSISGQLAIDADSGNPFTLHLVSLMNSTLPGDAANFDPLSAYAFDFVTAAGGVDGFSSDAFTIDASGFSNGFDGLWSVSLTNDSLQLVYTPTAVPEPATCAVIAGACGLGLAAWRRRRSFCALRSSATAPRHA